MLIVAVSIIAVAIASLIYLSPHKSNATAARPSVSPTPLTAATPSPSDLTCPPTELKITGVFEECAAVDKGQACLPNQTNPLWIVLLHGTKHDFLLYVEVDGVYHGAGTYLLSPLADGTAKVRIREYISGRMWESSAGSVAIVDIGSGGGWGGWIYAGLGWTRNSPVQTELNLAGWWACS
ncbi:MAG TPA: hypothetical protein VLU92_03915 [Candidatus Dormibacteraeota bacterium]|nr:hypothetical protein [Candidatus Dormibacteraeota bacterium]